MSTSTPIATDAVAASAQGAGQMNRNLQPPHGRSRSLARHPELEKDMWRAYLIGAGTVLGLIGLWALLVLFSA
jgi:hypothetical protein